jgi:hypothetical protein
LTSGDHEDLRNRLNGEISRFEERIGLWIISGFVPCGHKKRASDEARFQNCDRSASLGAPASIILFANAAVLIAEAVLGQVGGSGNGAEDASNGQGSNDAQDDLFHRLTPFVNTKTICDSSHLLKSTFFGHTGAALNRLQKIVALYPERKRS